MIEEEDGHPFLESDTAVSRTLPCDVNYLNGSLSITCLHLLAEVCFVFGCKGREFSGGMPDNYLSFAEQTLSYQGQILPTHPQIAREVRD